MTIVIAIPDSVKTYDKSIHCPSSWTVDQWMIPLKPILRRTCENLSSVQACILLRAAADKPRAVVPKTGSGGALDGRQDRYAVIGNPHFPVALAERAAKPGPLHRHDLGVRAAPKDGRQQAAGPTAVLVRAGHRIAGQHRSPLCRSLTKWSTFPFCVFVRALSWPPQACTQCPLPGPHIGQRALRSSAVDRSSSTVSPRAPALQTSLPAQCFSRLSFAFSSS